MRSFKELKKGVHDTAVMLKLKRKDLKSLRDEKEELVVYRDDLIDSREIMSAVGILAQQELKEILENLVTEALQVVFDETYSFSVEDVVQRNKAETNFFVVMSGSKMSLKDELGCGVLDVVSFVLRVILWAVASNKTRNTMVLDEPAKFVSRDKRPAFGEMMRKMSDLLDIQFVMVTHEPEFIQIADKSYSISQEDGISEVKEV